MSGWQPLVVNRVARKLAERLGVLALVVVVAWLVLGRGAEDAKHHRLGTAYLGYDARAACVLLRDERARVLDSGLIDGRGIVMTNDERTAAQSTPRKVLYVADAWEGVYRFYIDNAAAITAPDDDDLVLAHATQVCPEGYCAQADYGGLLAHPTRGLVLSDAQRQQLLVRKWNGYFEPAVGEPFLHSVRDVEWIPEERAFLAAIGDAPQEPTRSDPNGDKATGEIVWVPERPGKETFQSIAGLRRPVGVAWSARTKRLYVADVDGGTEVWSYYNRSANGWTKGGTLWRQDVGPFGRSIRLQDMVVADFDYEIVSKGRVKECSPYSSTGTKAAPKEEVVVSAGPDGIYLFHSDGSLLAKYYVGRPVAGLAWGPVDAKTGANWIYFTSGPQVGALKTLLKNPHPAAAKVDATSPPDSGGTMPESTPGNNSRPTPPKRPPASPPRDRDPTEPVPDDGTPTPHGDREPEPPPRVIPRPEVPAPISVEVLFDFDRDVITSHAARTLEEALEQWREQPGASLVIEAHADSLGNDAYNYALSERRARAIQRWLQTRGLMVEVELVPYGETKPRHDEATAEGRRRNRRGVIQISGRGLPQ